MKILLITGGNSSEREVSLKSAKNVKQTLEENGQVVKIYDLKKGYENLEKSALQSDILFPVLHGEEGEGGQLHKFISKINKPIVGTRNFNGMNEGWHKISFKRYCDKNDINTASWKIIKTKNDLEKFGFPSVLKDSTGGSSREVVILEKKSDTNKAIVTKILNSNNAFAEKYIKGTEITIGILDNKALPVIEIKPNKDSWFSYKTKYDGTTEEIPFAPSLDLKLQKRAQQIALKIHNHFNLGTYSRIDFIVSGNDIYALEINTIPGLTRGSLMPKAALAAGINFNQFLDKLINLAK